MAVLTAVALLCLVLSYNDLLVLALLNDLTCYGSLDVTGLDAVIIRNSKNFIESNLAALVAFELLNEDLVTDLNLVLLSTSLDYCVRLSFLLFFQSRCYPKAVSEHINSGTFRRPAHAVTRV